MLIVNNDFVYIHHPKTGGTFVTEMLRKIASETDDLRIHEVPVPKHAGVRSIPPEFQKLPVAINVRNVFEHYVSRYTFRWWAEPKRAQDIFDLDRIEKEYPDFPDLSFTDFLRMFNQWHLRLNESKNRVQILTNQEIGYNSREFIRLSSFDPMRLLENFDALNNQELMEMFKEFHFLRTEKLGYDLYDLLKKYGVNEKCLTSLLDAPPILPKKGGRMKLRPTWPDYFSSEDIDFILRRDRLYFRLFPDMQPNENCGSNVK